LRGRALRTLGAPDEWHKRIQSARQVVGPRLDQLTPKARSALEALQSGDRRPTDEEIEALDYLIRLLRPAPLVGPTGLPRLTRSEAFPTWDRFRKAIRPLLRAIVRIDSTGKGAFRKGQVGTGFLIAPRLIVTNRHVIAAISMSSRSVSVENAEIHVGQNLRSAAARLSGRAAVHPHCDVGVLELERAPVKVQPVLLPRRIVCLKPGDGVAVIGYPARDSRSPLFAERLFQNDYGRERAAPGEVLEIADPFVRYDCTTLGGNSGSPVFSLDNASLVGIHHSGLYLAANEAVGLASAAEFLHEQMTSDVK